MYRQYKPGYIFEESELPEVAKFCNENQLLMTTEYDVIKKEVEEENQETGEKETKEIDIHRYEIIEIPVEALQLSHRNKRNIYLETYVDPIITNLLRWEELSQEEKDNYKNYRKYLLDYTKEENWWTYLPKTFNEWKEEK